MSKLYFMAGLGIISLYAYSEWTGWVYSTPDSAPSAYSTSSGSRSGGGGGVFFWGSGTSGGK